MLTARKDTPLQFDPSLPGLAADPYPVYHRLRADDPVHWSPIVGMWVLTRYADTVAVLRDDSRFAKGGRQVLEKRIASGPPSRFRADGCSSSIRPTTRGFAAW